MSTGCWWCGRCWPAASTRLARIADHVSTEQMTNRVDVSAVGAGAVQRGNGLSVLQAPSGGGGEAGDRRAWPWLAEQLVEVLCQTGFCSGIA